MVSPAAQRSRAVIVPDVSRHLRRYVVAAGVLVAGSGLAACGGGSSAVKTTSSTAAPAKAGAPTCTKSAQVALRSGSVSGSSGGSVEQLPIATLRSRYLAISGPSNRTFARFANQLQALNSAVTSAQLRAAIVPAARAITSAANGFWCLHLASPPKLAKAFRTVAVDDYVVYQALGDLAGNYGSRGFDIHGWGTSSRQAIVAANSAQSALQRELGLH